MGAGEIWEMREHDMDGETRPMIGEGETSRGETGGREAGRDESHVIVANGRDRRLDTASGRRLSNPNTGERRLANGPMTVGSSNHGTDTIDHPESDRYHNGLWGFNHNRYATRKTAAQGMMDMALMLANASQLKSVLQEGESHQHYILLLFLISLSIALQIFTGIVLLVVGARESKCEDDDDKRNHKTNKLNNFSVALVFLITVTNIFITSFGINGNTSGLSVSGYGSGEVNNVVTGVGGGSTGVEPPVPGT